jgi:outer membrane protein
MYAPPISDGVPLRLRASKLAATQNPSTVGLLAIVSITGSLALSAEAFSQTAETAQMTNKPVTFQMTGKIGASGRLAPAYEGSGKFLLSPEPLISIDSLTLGHFSFGGAKRTGFSLAPSLRLRSARTAAKFPELTGVPDVERAYELGAKLQYDFDKANVFTTIRKGFGGHHGLVGEVGGNLVLSPSEAVELTFGPRARWASSAYANTYFSVPAATATLPAYDASSGIYAVGLEAGIEWRFNDAWSVEASASWHRLTGSIGRSPIVSNGRNQFESSLGLTRSFDVSF